MNDEQWRLFFEISGEVLGKGDVVANMSESWCAWTTFGQLASNAVYWQAGLPNADELLPTHIADSGTWGQPFSYHELAHVIIPRTFDQESVEDGQYRCFRKQQDIEELSRRLTEHGIDHRNTDLVLEIKLF
jgi:hypothetical protein